MKQKCYSLNNYELKTMNYELYFNKTCIKNNSIRYTFNH